MAKPIAKSKRPEAERAVEWALHRKFNCLHTRRALRTKFARVDFFGCDVIGVFRNGAKFWVQVTAGQAGAVLTRRKKLLAYPWHDTDIVEVWQLVERANIVNPRKKSWFFRRWRLDSPSGVWFEEGNPVYIEDEWFTAYREDGKA